MSGGAVRGGAVGQRRRRRLGVALLLDPPVANEVDTLRRALGDTTLGRVAPHLTLVPPVNVREDQLASALSVLREAAARQRGPLELALGPVSTFLPVNPVLYLAVGAEDPSEMGALARLHDSALAGPLSKPERWEWAPHVTLHDDCGPEKIAAAMTALASYRADVVFDRVVLLEERDHVWEPIADTNLGAPAFIGRGGLDLEITQGRVAGPDVLDVVDAAGGREAWESSLRPPAALSGMVVLTGRRGGAVAGAAVAWQIPLGRQGGGSVHAGVLVVPEQRGLGVGRALLRAVEVAVVERGWPNATVVGHGPASFYTHCSAWVTVTN